jgi:hypothetical protein
MSPRAFSNIIVLANTLQTPNQTPNTNTNTTRGTAEEIRSVQTPLPTNNQRKYHTARPQLDCVPLCLLPLSLVATTNNVCTEEK